MLGCSLIITTTDSIDIVKNLAFGLIEQKLSNCIQYHKVISIYNWESKTEESEEYRLHIKADNNNISKIKDLILSLHNYDLPELVVLEIKEGHKAYLDWIKEFR